MRALFITGASGFVGRRLLDSLPPGLYGRIIALSRGEQPARPGVTWVRGDIADPSSYSSLLTSHTDIAHLAAATGAAAADVHQAVNAAGTAGLLRAAEAANAAGLVFVSSIAAGFPDDGHYPYASSKRAAESAVRASRVPALIVRPTIVLGEGSPILGKLRSLASGPVVLAIGGGRARVQPIHVDDLARALALLLERRAFDGSTLELGGPDILSMAGLLQRVRAAMGKSTGRIVAIPYRPMRASLAAMTALLRHRSPATPGQIASFVQDGVAEPNALWEELKPGMRGVDDMVRTAP